MDSTNVRKNVKYFNFPLCFLELISKEGKQSALNEICAWAIVNYGKTINYTPPDIAKQIVYLYYRHKDKLMFDIGYDIDTMVENEEFFIDPDYEGFYRDTFDPQNGEVEALLEIFDKDLEFKANCFRQCQHLQAKKILNITGGSVVKDYINYKKLNTFLNEFEAVNGRDAWTSVKTSYLFDARDGKLPINLFRLVCAVKSIIGKRNFSKTYKNVVLHRMFGAKKTELLSDESKKEFEILTRRRQWYKLIRTAEKRKLVTFVPAPKGYFVSMIYGDEKLRKEILKRTVKAKPKKKIITSKEYDINNTEFSPN